MAKALFLASVLVVCVSGYQHRLQKDELLASLSEDDVCAGPDCDLSLRQLRATTASEMQVREKEEEQTASEMQVHEEEEEQQGPTQLWSCQKCDTFAGKWKKGWTTGVVEQHGCQGTVKFGMQTCQLAMCGRHIEGSPACKALNMGCEKLYEGYTGYIQCRDGSKFTFVPAQ